MRLVDEPNIILYSFFLYKKAYKVIKRTLYIIYIYQELLKMEKIINDLVEKYKDSEYLTGRLVNYIEHLLPAALESDALSA